MCTYIILLSQFFAKLRTLISICNVSKFLDAEGRGRRKDKILMPLLFASLLIKSIIFPLALKAMAVMTSVAVFISGLSLILSSLVGYRKIATTPYNPYIKRLYQQNQVTPQETNFIYGAAKDYEKYDYNDNN